jgi:acetolactate synthase-1/2/3 large subunit
MVTGAQALVESLKREGTKVIFGIPGGAIMPVYDVLYDASEIRHILMRHEQGAAHAADGYARASGRPGVCLVTSGPGATNLITGIATAYMDSSPVVSMAGQVPSSLIGTDAFQEADIFSLMLPITKSNFLVKNASEIPQVVKRSFELAISGRPGPVHIDLPKDIQTAEFEPDWPEKEPGPRDRPKPDLSVISKIVEMLTSSEMPVILAGGGAIQAGCSKEILALSELLAAPVVTTLMGKGIVPETHPLCLGMLGMHGLKVANKAVQESDLLFGIGVRFDDRATGNVRQFAPKAKIIHLDIDPSEFEKNVRADLTVSSDAKSALGMIVDLLLAKAAKLRKSEWLQRIERLRMENTNDTYPPSQPISPQFAVKEIMRALDEDDIIVTEVGQNQMWAAIYCKISKPRNFITSGGLGTMGFGFPAAIGAKVARPESNVVDIAGDGSFLMNCNQMAAAVENGIPVVVTVLNNHYLGMVRQWQELFMKKRYSAVYLGERTDFVKLAESFGARGWKVEKPGELLEAVREALKCGSPALVDVEIAREANASPMVPPGASLDEIID